MSTITSGADVTGEVVAAHRAALGLGREKYAERLGEPFTPGGIHRIEKQGKIRPEEAEILAEIIARGDTIDQRMDDTPDAEEDSGPPVVLLSELDYDAAPAIEVLPPSPEAVAVVAETPAEQEPAPNETPRPVTLPAPTLHVFERDGYHITNSEMTTLGRCRRKWYLAYYRGLKSQIEEVVGPRAIGTRVHIALAAYYGPDAEDPLRVYADVVADDRSRLDVMTSPEKVDQFDSEAELGRIMLEGYVEWVTSTGADADLEVVGVEEVVEAEFPVAEGTLPEPVIVTGKMDMRVRRASDGVRLFADHKTVADLTTPAKTLHMDPQMMHYLFLEMLQLHEQTGTPLGAPADAFERSDGGLYNMLRKVKRTARATPPFYERVEVRRNIHELRSYYLKVLGVMQDIFRLRAALDDGGDHRHLAPPTPMSDCSWSCDFFAVCTMLDDGSRAEDMLGEHFRVGHPQAHYMPYGEREHIRQVGDDNAHA